MIEVNKEYSTEEFKAALGISKRAWDTRREEILEYCEDFFRFDIKIKGRAKTYVVKEIYAEFEPLPRKTKSAEKSRFYLAQASERIEEQPLNTSSNLGRIIFQQNNKYDVSETTITKTLRPLINLNYDKTNYQWCKLDRDINEYIPLTDEQGEYLIQCLSSSYKEDYKNIVLEQNAALVNAYFNREISRKEFDAQAGQMLIDHYTYSMNLFKGKYGFWPVRVPTLVRKNDELKISEEEIV